MADTDPENGRRERPGGLLAPVPRADLQDPPEALRRNWGWLLALGIALLIGGAAAVLLPVAASIAVELAVGVAMLVGGAIQLVQAVRCEGWRARALALLAGALYLVGGALLLINPLAGLVALTLVMLTVFIVDGGFRIAMALRMRPERGWGWVLTGGVLSALLGAGGVLLFPGISLTLLGIIAGVSLIFEGWSFVFVALAARRGGAGGDGTEQPA